ncbi:MAG: hypothetical protein WAT78_10565 [Rhizobiaceae bacterium]
MKMRLALAILLLSATAAQAACPIELAVYEEAETGASLTFRPAASGAATATHAFKLGFSEHGVELDGMVLATDPPVRPWGMALHKCPMGDATGAELDACTIWQGVIYGVNEQGHVDLMPPEGGEAPKTLLLPDFGRAVRLSAIWGAAGVSKAPWDVFELKGCQE